MNSSQTENPTNILWEKQLHEKIYCSFLEESVFWCFYVKSHLHVYPKIFSLHFKIVDAVNPRAKFSRCSASKHKIREWMLFLVDVLLKFRNFAEVQENKKQNSSVEEFLKLGEYWNNYHTGFL